MFENKLGIQDDAAGRRSSLLFEVFEQYFSVMLSNKHSGRGQTCSRSIVTHDDSFDVLDRIVNDYCQSTSGPLNVSRFGNEVALSSSDDDDWLHFVSFLSIFIAIHVPISGHKLSILIATPLIVLVVIQMADYGLAIRNLPEVSVNCWD